MVGVATTGVTGCKVGVGVAGTGDSEVGTDTAADGEGVLVTSGVWVGGANVTAGGAVVAVGGSGVLVAGGGGVAVGGGEVFVAVAVGETVGAGGVQISSKRIEGSKPAVVLFTGPQVQASTSPSPKILFEAPKLEYFQAPSEVRSQYDQYTHVAPWH